MKQEEKQELLKRLNESDLTKEDKKVISKLVDSYSFDHLDRLK